MVNPSSMLKNSINIIDVFLHLNSLFIRILRDNSLIYSITHIVNASEYVDF